MTEILDNYFQQINLIKFYNDLISCQVIIGTYCTLAHKI